MARDDERTGEAESTESRTLRPEDASSHASSTGRRSERGFAAMDPAAQRRIAAKGGKASSDAQRRASSGRFAGRRRTEDENAESDAAGKSQTNGHGR